METFNRVIGLLLIVFIVTGTSLIAFSNLEGYQKEYSFSNSFSDLNRCEFVNRGDDGWYLSAEYEYEGNTYNTGYFDESEGHLYCKSIFIKNSSDLDLIRSENVNLVDFHIFELYENSFGTKSIIEVNGFYVGGIIYYHVEEMPCWKNFYDEEFKVNENGVVVDYTPSKTEISSFTILTILFFMFGFWKFSKD